MGNCFSSNKKANVHDSEKILISNQGKSKKSPLEEKDILMKKNEYKQTAITPVVNTMAQKKLKEKTLQIEGEKADKNIYEKAKKETKLTISREENKLYIKTSDQEEKQLLVTAQDKNSRKTVTVNATKTTNNLKKKNQKDEARKADLEPNKNIISNELNTVNENDKVGSDDNIVKKLDNEKDYKEKLRVTVNYFMGEIDPEEGNEEERQSKIRALIKNDFAELLKVFDVNGQRYRVTTKILQVLDILLAETNRISSYKDIYSTIKSKIAPEPDWRVLRKIYDHYENNELDLEIENILTNGFMRRLKIIKKELLWREDEIKFKLIGSILDELESKFYKDPTAF